MAATSTHHRLLLPVGLENSFFAITEELPSQGGAVPFQMDRNAFRFLAQEVVSQGAVHVVIDSFSSFNKDRELLGTPLLRRVKAVDHRKQTHADVIRILQPICDELKIDLTDTSSLMHSFVSPLFAEFLDTSDASRRSLIEASFVLYTSLYHLMLGMKHKAQIDIDLAHTWCALQRLRTFCRSDTAQTNISMISGVIRTYKVEAVGEIRAKANYDLQILLDCFSDFIEDETYRQLSIERNLLGVPAYARRSLASIRRLSRDLARSKLFRGVFRYSVGAVAVASHVPSPASEFSDAALASADTYLPPIAPLHAHVENAWRRWATANPAFTPIFFASPIPLRTPPLNCLESKFEDDVLTILYDVHAFLAHYQFGELPEAHDPRVHAAFSRHIEAKEPAQCPVHNAPITFEDVTVDWSTWTVAFKVSACCREGSEIAFAHFLSVSDAKT